ncbi:hypothetical protein AMATHDRAFT_1711 [Amanita thiersii Skay4041]|uniref:LsmAD domain-containing protein n=1 Tax=Amanita thiersii Skay4041 TaxID=703135 RepID=A0A2A9NYL8_9AGAR|nr:hypothetical protein AMATHDRAFT_1711 [Amanita thiersii Skay4041]
MASTRQSKSGGKGLPGTARRGSAWGTGARASPTFSPTNNPSRAPSATAPPSGFTTHTQLNGARHDGTQDRVLHSLSGLTGTTVVLSTKTGQRYEGVIGSTGGEGDTTGVTLKDVKELTNPGAPLKDHLFIASTNIDTWSSGPADSKPSNGDSFRTDTDISQKKVVRERELQAWQPGSDTPNMPPSQNDETFGAASSNTSWDQFAVNEKLFGVRTNFDEDLYTTKLDRSGADFKERERKAQRIANEILGTATSNPHVLEERGHIIDDTNEEDKYGAVVRGSNAYIPPPARKQAAMASTNASATTKADPPKVIVNGVETTTQSPPVKTSSPAPTASATSTQSSASASTAPANKPPADPLPAFRDFVVNEKQRLTQKRQALVRSEMDKKIAELVKFGRSFKLNKPIPEDLVTILAKDEEKQRAIREKATQDAQSSQARSIGAPSPANASRGIPINAAKVDATRKLAAATPVVKTPAVGSTQASSNTTQKVTISTKPAGAETGNKKPTISMYIQPIPPFRGSKSRAQGNGSTSTTGSGTTTNSLSTASGSNGSANNTPVSPSTARLNANASSFRPNPKASSFTPGANSPSTSNQSVPSPKVKAETVPTTPNPFFGKQIKKTNVVPLKDDFNPFKHGKVTEPSQTSQLWPYTGKRYSLMFPVPQHPPPPHPTHMVPPGPPPMPPPSYEEDSAAQAAARGYVYAYPPYAYPGQPMMPGMAPPGPPTAYLPGPFMHPMPYPPGMPPPAAMYSPAMGQMPPPQAYMPPPPPPGAYPPPPNGAGPRPSMPPTPIPAHAHTYYQQSPQSRIPSYPYVGKMFTMPTTVQHAVPYPMMMPPPPGVPPHPYEGGPAPPVQMGGHA